MGENHAMMRKRRVKVEAQSRKSELHTEKRVLQAEERGQAKKNLQVRRIREITRN